MRRLHSLALGALIAAGILLGLGAAQTGVVNLCPGAGVCIGTGNAQPVELWSDGTRRLAVSPAGVLTVGSSPTSPQLASYRFGQMSASATVNNTETLSTPANADPLTFAVGANEKWHVTYTLIFNSAANADYKVGLTYPTGTTFNLVATCITVAGSAISNLQMTAIFQDGPLACGGIAGFAWMIAEGVIDTGSTAGNIAVAFAQNTAQMSDTVLGLTSTMTAFRVE